MNESRSRVEHGSSAPSWHTLETARVLDDLGTTSDGLREDEASARLERFGANRLRPATRRGPLRRFASQFHNVLIYILILAACVTAALGHWVDTAVIAAVVVINAAIGFIQEGKAERALDAIRSLLSPKAAVIRDGRLRTVDAETLVPGDIVQLASGDRVPADVRLLRCQHFRVDEAMLTGESLPADKRTEPVDAEAALGDRADMAFSGTLVTSGRATAVVVATGEHTEIGGISTMLAEVEQLTTPLLRTIARFGRQLSVGILALAAATIAFGTLARDYALDEMFLAAVGLAVAAIPEGLPAIITITLALGVQRMAGRHVLIRRLPAVETLGAVTVICSDKTGTLTRNEMTARAVVTAGMGDGVYEIAGVGYAPAGGFSLDGRALEPEDAPELIEVLRAGVLCNDAAIHEHEGEWRLEGDPTEGALVSAAAKAGLEATFEREERPRLDAIPFESEHQFMATLHHDHAGHSFIFLKGAPERVIAMCERERRGGDDHPIDRRYWFDQMHRRAERGERLLAVAFRSADPQARELRFGDVEGGLTLLGLVGLIDPPRDEAIAAVRECHAAGIRVKMITGDHGATARAIADQIGIGAGGGVLRGDELTHLDPDALQREAERVDVFARAAPEHKLKLVEALQSQNRIVAMTGDGVNDAPALRRADVGVAMGVKGTEVSKQAAEMVLTDDNFASIVAGVEEGRTVYDNIRKTLTFILPTNGAQAMTIIAAVLAGLALPITPVQILWVNTVTAVTLGLALAFEPAERDIMDRPPRDPNAPLLSRFLVWRTVFVSLLLLAPTFGLFLWERAAGAPLELARTAAVNALVIGEVFYLFNSRFLHGRVLTPGELLGSRYVVIAIGIVLVLQLLFTYTPAMQAVFETRPLAGDTWARIVAAGVVIFFLVELEKWIVRRGVGRPKIEYRKS